MGRHYSTIVAACSAVAVEGTTTAIVGWEWLVVEVAAMVGLEVQHSTRN